MGRRRKTTTKDLERGKVEFEKWRCTRKKRGAVPERLWRMAVKLARKHGIYQTAKALRVNYESLKKRLNGAGEKQEPTSFVEVVPTDAPIFAGNLIEIEGARGEKIRIRLSGSEKLDLCELVRGVWGKR